MQQQAQQAVGSPGHVRREGRSRDLWEAALTLFAERGYRGTTTRDLARELGIRAPSLYNHMRSKQEVLQEIMFTTMERALGAQREAPEGTDDPAEQLRRVAEAHARLMIRRRREVLITHRELPSLGERDRAVIGGQQRKYVRVLHAIVERGLSQGRFDVESPRVASFAVLEMLNGLEKWYRETGRHSEDDVVRQYGEFPLGIAGARESRRG